MATYGAVPTGPARGMYQPPSWGGNATTGGGGGSNFQPITDAYKVYNTAAGQNAQDYSGIMKGYQNILSAAPSASSVDAVRNLGELSRTGGYSDADKADIRARGVSPIRSVYSSANRDIDRQKSLQGGYSPNYTAAKTKMAREMSNVISDKNTDINAQLAQNVAGNRINVAGTYASAAGHEQDIPLQALSGMSSIYSASPGLTQTFGNQANQQAQLQNQINQAPAIGGSSGGGSIYGPGFDNNGNRIAPNRGMVRG